MFDASILPSQLRRERRGRGSRGTPLAHRSPADLPMQSSTGGEIAEAEHDLYQAIDVVDVDEEITVFAKMPSVYPLVRR